LLRVVEHISKLVGRNVGEPQTTAVERFVDLDDRFAHEHVRFLRTARKEKVLAASDSLMTVVSVERQAQQPSYAFFRNASFTAHRVFRTLNRRIKKALVATERKANAMPGNLFGWQHRFHAPANES